MTFNQLHRYSPNLPLRHSYPPSLFLLLKLFYPPSLSPHLNLFLFLKPSYPPSLNLPLKLSYLPNLFLPLSPSYPLSLSPYSLPWPVRRTQTSETLQSSPRRQ